MDKIIEFKNRNRKRNCHLYSVDKIEGVDYVVCPLTNERMSMIKRTYIERVLGLTVEQYDSMFPGIQKICRRRIQNIKDGLSSIDTLTGKTKYEVSQEKAKVTLNTVGDDGLSGYARKGLKTKQTHLETVDEFGRNGYQRQAYFRLNTLLPNGLTIEQNAHLKVKDTLLKKGITRVVGASAVSKRVLNPIIQFLDSIGVKFYFDKMEYSINVNGEMFYYDLTIPEFNMVIEYQSNAWHADPRMSLEKWQEWRTPKGEKKTANEVSKRDYYKARMIYEHRGFRTFFVWEDSQEHDVEEILCLLKTLSMKS